MVRVERAVPVSGEWGTAQDAVWAGQLGATAPDVKVLTGYGKSNGWLDGQPAAVTRTLGKGSIKYVGCALDEQSMMNAAKWMVAKSGATTLLPNLPTGVEVSVRSGLGKTVWIISNFQAVPETMKLPVSMEDVLGGGSVSTGTLPQYGISVLRLP